MNKGFENVLTVGPGLKRKGGIASVLKKYREYYKAPYFSSTFFQKTLFSFLFFPERIISFLSVLAFNSKIEIVHIHTSSEGSFYRKYVLLRIARLFKKKVVIHIHSGRFLQFYLSSNKFVKKAINNSINNADCLAVLSQSWEKKYRNSFSPCKVDVIPNLISKPIDSDNNAAKNSKIKIIYLGKIFQAKGIYDLLDCIFENYQYYYENVSFAIAGNGEEEKTRIYREKDTKGIIDFTGWINDEQKNKLLKESDILILPSYSEGLPVSILEAMSFKMPIIASPVGGIPEIVSNNVNGKFVTPGNKKEIHDAISYYINNKHMIKEHGLNSYKKVKPHFPENVKKALLNIYQSL